MNDKIKLSPGAAQSLAEVAAKVADHIKDGTAAREFQFETKAMRAVRAVVMGELEDAYTKFHGQPAGPYFGQLERAMYAAQFIAQDSGRRFVMDTLVNVPVVRWLEAIETHLDESGRK